MDRISQSQLEMRRMVRASYKNPYGYVAPVASSEEKHDQQAAKEAASAITSGQHALSKAYYEEKHPQHAAAVAEVARLYEASGDAIESHGIRPNVIEE